MRFCVTILFFMSFVILSGTVFADPNSPAEEKPWSYDFPGMRTTYPEAEPNDVCPGQTISCGDAVNPARIETSADVDYYEIELSAGLWVTIGTDASDQGDPDLTDSYLELYGPDCSQPRLTYDDDGGPGLYSLITNYLVPATGLYHIKVRGFSATYTGYYQLFVTCAFPPPPPVNDTCDGALPLDRCSGGTIAGDLTMAVNNYSPQPPSPGCTGYAANGKDIVYLLNLQLGDVVHLVYTTPAYDGSIYIVTDCTQPGATCAAGEDDPEPETINWTVTTAGTYYLIVDAYATNAGSAFTLDWSIDCPGPQGACCAPDGTCRQTIEADCQLPNTWYAGVACTPNPCEPQLGVCCNMAIGACTITTEAECDAMPGPCLFGWMGPDLTCDPNPCPIQTDPPGACCNQATGECRITASLECMPPLQWIGPCIPCTPTPCEVIPTNQSSWGRIKNRYR